MEMTQYVTAIAALLFVLGLLSGLLWLVRRFFSGALGIPNAKLLKGKSRRVTLVESSMLDMQHRVLIFVKDGVEYCVLTGPKSMLMIERAGKNEPSEPQEEVI